MGGSRREASKKERDPTSPGMAAVAGSARGCSTSSADAARERPRLPRVAVPSRAKASAASSPAARRFAARAGGGLLLLGAAVLLGVWAAPGSLQDMATPVSGADVRRLGTTGSVIGLLEGRGEQLATSLWQLAARVGQLGGFAQDSGTELGGARHPTDPEDATGFLSALTRGRAERDLGRFEAALRLFELALRRAVSAEERWAALSDLGDLHARRGDAAKSKACLGEAQEILRSSDIYAEEIRRIKGAKATEPSAGSAPASQAPDSTAGLAGTAAGSLQGPRPAGLSSQQLQDSVKDLLNAGELEKAESAVADALDAYRARDESVAIASAHNVFGWVRRAQGRLPEAAQLHLEALTLSLKAGGPLSAGTPVADAAYRGLSNIQASLSSAGKTQEAAALLTSAVAVADAARVRQDDPARKRGESRLRPSSPPTVLAGRAAAASGRKAGPPRPAELRDSVIGLVRARDLKRAEAAVVAALDTYQLKQDPMATAVALNLLGRIRRAQGRYSEAARRHMRALTLGLRAGGLAAANSLEVKAAYRGLSAVQSSLLSIGRRSEAFSLLRHAVAAADAADVPWDAPGRRWGERRLRTSARAKASVGITGSAPRRTDVQPRPAELQDFVIDLLKRWELKEADFTVAVALDVYRSKRDKMATAVAHNLLGKVRRAQGRLPEAARQHIQALELALGAGGITAAATPEARGAYLGLGGVQASFHLAGAPKEAVALLDDAEEVANAAGVPRERPGRQWGEGHLRANAWPLAFAMAAAGQGRARPAPAFPGFAAPGRLRGPRSLPSRSTGPADA